MRCSLGCGSGPTIGYWGRRWRTHVTCSVRHNRSRGRLAVRSEWRPRLRLEPACRLGRGRFARVAGGRRLICGSLVLGVRLHIVSFRTAGLLRRPVNWPSIARFMHAVCDRHRFPFETTWFGPSAGAHPTTLLFVSLLDTFNGHFGIPKIGERAPLCPGIANWLHAFLCKVAMIGLRDITSGLSDRLTATVWSLDPLRNCRGLRDHNGFSPIGFAGRRSIEWFHMLVACRCFRCAFCPLRLVLRHRLARCSWKRLWRN